MESGRSRDDAYRIVQENAQRAWDTGTPFRDLLAEVGFRDVTGYNAAHAALADAR